ncbi:MAG TPA: universal stress protein [Steroidobacteraceae bacterium]|nr:universal stress protein [Steroidobacteraceae bacterium]
MRAIRRILFAVKNPDARRQAGIDKAIDIAKRLGASIELFHAISSPVFLDLQPLTATSLADLRRESLALRQRRLEAHAARAGVRGVTVECKVEWDYPPHEAIVRRAARARADLIIAECHEGSRLKHWFMPLTDWELLRTSQVPVLLFRNTVKYQRPAILAAVDPSHLHAKPARLDAEIVAVGEQFADSLRGTLHATHANYPAVFGLTRGDPGIDAVSLAATYEEQKRKDGADFAAFAQKAGIARTRRHSVDGDPAYAIPKVARAMRAQVVVMGAVSRSGLKRVFIGNTAERVLNSLACDVLVVKPPRFEKRVKSASRGMRVIASPPVFPLPV